jgi:site-specific DNA recombinase
MLKAIILARVSTEEQMTEGHSIPAQLEKARQYVLHKGFELKNEYRFDESSLKDHRVKFEQVIDEIRKSNEKIALIVETVDRLQRGFKESVLLDDFRKQGKLEIHFIRENLIVRSESNSSEIQRWDLGVFLAKSYVLQISDNVKRSIEQKLRNGEYPALAPFGYVNSRIADKNTIEPHPYKSKIARKIFEWYASGAYSMGTIAEKVQEDFHIKIQKSRVDAILHNSFYYGEIKWKGKLYPHKYTPLISRDLYIVAQNTRLGFKKQPYKLAGKINVLYRGLIRCGHCGCSYTPERKLKKSGRQYIYYRCTGFKGKCGSKWLREEELTKQISAYFEKIRIPDDVAEGISQILKSSHEGKKEFYQDVSTELKTQFEKFEKRIESIYEDKLDGEVSEEFYKKKVQEYRREQNNIKVKMDNLQKADEQYYFTANFLLLLARKAPELFKSSKPDIKRQLFKLVLSNPTINDGTLCATIRKPFSYFAEGLSRSNWGGRRDLNPQRLEPQSSALAGLSYAHHEILFTYYIFFSLLLQQWY